MQLARALAQIWEPPVSGRYLLLDEPTSSLDLAHQHSILGVVRRFAAHGVRVLVILQDLYLAAQYADNLLILKEGKKVIGGPPGEALTPQVIQTAFSIQSLVIPHPLCPLPLVVPLNALSAQMKGI